MIAVSIGIIIGVMLMITNCIIIIVVIVFYKKQCTYCLREEIMELGPTDQCIGN